MTIDCHDSITVAQLYQRVGPFVLDKCRKMLRNGSVAEEIVQEVFLSMHRKAPVFEFEKQAFRWLYQACHNRCLDHLRSAPIKTTAPVEEQFWNEVADASDLGAELQSSQEVRRILQPLPERTAAILWYIAVDGMTQDEVAEFLEISRATVAREFRDGKAILKERRQHDQ